MSWKTDMAPKLKFNRYWNFTLTEMLQNLKISSKWNLNQNKIQEIGKDPLGLVYLVFTFFTSVTVIFEKLCPGW